MISKVTAMNKITKYTKKTLAVILAGAFLFTNTLSWAKEEELFSAGTENTALSSGSAGSSKLAPSSRLNSEEFKISLTVAAICKHIEHDGNLNDKSYLNDVLARLDADKNPNITVLPYEIIIEIPNEGLMVRYFDPTKTNVITSYSDISRLKTKVIGPRLNRQIIYRTKPLGYNKPPRIIINGEEFEILRHEWHGKDRYRYHYTTASQAEDEIQRDKATKMKMNEELKELENRFGFSTILERVDKEPGGEYSGDTASYKYIDTIAVYRSTVDGKLYMDLGSFRSRSLHIDKAKNEIMTHEIAQNMGVTNIAEITSAPGALWGINGHILVRIVQTYSDEELRKMQADDIEGLLTFYVKTRDVDHWDGHNLLKRTVNGINYYVSFDHGAILDESTWRSLDEFVDIETFDGKAVDSETINKELRRLDPINDHSLETRNEDFLVGIKNFLEDAVGITPEDFHKIDLRRLAGHIGTDEDLRRDIEIILSKIYDQKVTIEPYKCMISKRPNYVDTIYQIPRISGPDDVPKFRIFEIFELKLTPEETRQVIENIRQNPDSKVMLLKREVLEMAQGGEKAKGVKLNKKMGIIPKRFIEGFRRPRVNIGNNCPVILEGAGSDELKNILGDANEIYVSPAGLFRIQINDPILGELYLVALNSSALERGELDVTPIGGGYRFDSPEDLRWYIKNGNISMRGDEMLSLEMRKHIQRKDISKYLALFNKGVHREVVPLRELKEELIDELRLFERLPEGATDLTTWKQYREETPPAIESDFYRNCSEYITKNNRLFKDTIKENKPDTLLRVPVEVAESVYVDNIKNFLATFQEAPNGYVELYYMSGMGEVSESVYQKYGLQKKSLPKNFKRTRENTVTLFPAFKGEEINQSTIVSRLGSFNITPENTILSPIGLQHDPAGLIRATILGLKIMDIARQVKEGKPIDKDAVHVDILNQLRGVLDASDFKNFDLTPDDIIALATGNINNILVALKKLIKLLPIAPINAEELRQIYEHVKEVITAA